MTRHGRSRGRVVVAMSGGVDSSVTAGLLKEDGWDVVGMTMKVWPGEGDASRGQRSCCGTDAVGDARRVCEILDVPYYVLDMAEVFERQVIGNFVSEYLAGRTPNPCIRCNTDMKFGRVLERAREIGAQKVATGHYARLTHDRTTGRWAIERAHDLAKDQSYTLWGLTQEQLSRALFPLGELVKSDVRAIAERMGLPVSAKPDSQDICFVSSAGYREFLAGRARVGDGQFVDRQGRALGNHPGYPNFTVGQRRGLGIATGERTYVVGIDPATNRVVLGLDADLACRSFRVTAANWVAVPAPVDPVVCAVKIRSQGELVPGRVQATGPGATVALDAPVRAVAPGQSAVFYDHQHRVLGGGLIEVET